MISREEIKQDIFNARDTESNTIHLLTLHSYIEKLYDSFEAELKERDEAIQEYKDMIEWMEQNSNGSICDWYNRSES